MRIRRLLFALALTLLSGATPVPVHAALGIEPRRLPPAATQAAFDRSRETIFTTDRDVRPRVLCIYGGKLKGWRAAAAHVMQRISPSLPAAEKRAETDLLILRRPT